MGSLLHPVRTTLRKADAGNQFQAKRGNVNKKKTTQAAPSTPSSLHIELADRITRLLHEEGAVPGMRLNEKHLSEQLGVSRTPVRAALEHLSRQGFTRRTPNIGVELLALPPLPPAEVDARGDELLARIARDRHSGHLPDQVAEQDLMLAYDLTRAAVKEALGRLAELGVVERKLGYRWKFFDNAYVQAKQESYRFRLVIEPAAILEPTFALPPGWIAQMRAQHEAFLHGRWTDSAGVAFFEMNASFHEGLARASGNRFFLEALQKLNRLRRLSNYDWKYGRDRVSVSCNEHLAILKHLDSGDVGNAAMLMRQHLELASRINVAGKKA